MVADLATTSHRVHSPLAVVGDSVHCVLLVDVLGMIRRTHELN